MSMKPLPTITSISQPFWAGLQDGIIQALHCDVCSKKTFYPRKHCQHCWSPKVKWVAIEGRGTLYSYTIARIPTLPEFADEAPQILAVVELADGVRMNTTLLNVSEDEIKIGMSLVAVLDTVNKAGMTLIRFTADSGVNKITGLEYQNPLNNLQRNEEGRVLIDVKNEAALFALVDGEFTPWSNKFKVTQNIINQFAELSGDNYWIHTDPSKAATDSPYKTTIAHGALVQVLQSKLQIPFHYEILGFKTMVNYGSNKLRFPAPVPVDSEIHARAKVKSVDFGHKGLQVILEIHTHVVGESRPSVINELVIFYR